MDFYMIQTEKQLKKIIKETLILTEAGKEIDDVIDKFSNQFEKANEIGESNEAIIAVRKNNTLLELILLLVEIPSKEGFEDFYKNSKLIPKENTEKFWKDQGDARIDDKKTLRKLISDFLKKINDRSSVNSAEKFLSELKNLKNGLNNYIPKWYVLQYLFFNIDAEGFGKVLDEFCQNSSNFDTPITDVKGFQIPLQAKLTGLLNNVKAAINKGELTEEDKKEILGETVRSEEFSNGIERGEWGWLTGAIDTAVNFFFPDVRSITGEVEDFFNNAEKVAGGKKKVKKIMDRLKNENSIKDLIRKMGMGEISEEDIKKAGGLIINMQDSITR